MALIVASTDEASRVTREGPTQGMYPIYVVGSDGQPAGTPIGYTNYPQQFRPEFNRTVENLYEDPTVYGAPPAQVFEGGATVRSNPRLGVGAFYLEPEAEQFRATEQQRANIAYNQDLVSRLGGTPSELLPLDTQGNIVSASGKTYNTLAQYSQGVQDERAQSLESTRLTGPSVSYSPANIINETDRAAATRAGVRTSVEGAIQSIPDYLAAPSAQPTRVSLTQTQQLAAGQDAVLGNALVQGNLNLTASTKASLEDNARTADTAAFFTAIGRMPTQSELNDYQKAPQSAKSVLERQIDYFESIKNPTQKDVNLFYGNLFGPGSGIPGSNTLVVKSSSRADSSGLVSEPLQSSQVTSATLGGIKITYNGLDFTESGPTVINAAPSAYAQSQFLSAVNVPAPQPTQPSNVNTDSTQLSAPRIYLGPVSPNQIEAQKVSDIMFYAVQNDRVYRSLTGPPIEEPSVGAKAALRGMVAVQNYELPTSDIKVAPVLEDLAKTIIVTGKSIGQGAGSLAGPLGSGVGGFVGEVAGNIGAGVVSLPVVVPKLVVSTLGFGTDVLFDQKAAQKELANSFGAIYQAETNPVFLTTVAVGAAFTPITEGAPTFGGNVLKSGAQAVADYRPYTIAKAFASDATSPLRNAIKANIIETSPGRYALSLLRPQAVVASELNYELGKPVKQPASTQIEYGYPNPDEIQVLGEPVPEIVSRPEQNVARGTGSGNLQVDVYQSGLLKDYFKVDPKPRFYESASQIKMVQYPEPINVEGVAGVGPRVSTVGKLSEVGTLREIYQASFVPERAGSVPVTVSKFAGTESSYVPSSDLISNLADLRQTNPTPENIIPSSNNLLPSIGRAPVRLKVSFPNQIATNTQALVSSAFKVPVTPSGEISVSYTSPLGGIPFIESAEGVVGRESYFTGGSYARPLNFGDIGIMDPKSIKVISSPNAFGGRTVYDISMGPRPLENYEYVPTFTEAVDLSESGYSRPGYLARSNAEGLDILFGRIDPLAQSNAQSLDLLFGDSVSRLPEIGRANYEILSDYAGLDSYTKNTFDSLPFKLFPEEPRSPPVSTILEGIDYVEYQSNADAFARNSPDLLGSSVKRRVQSISSVEGSKEAPVLTNFVKDLGFSEQKPGSVSTTYEIEGSKYKLGNIDVTQKPSQAQLTQPGSLNVDVSKVLSSEKEIYLPGPEDITLKGPGGEPPQFPLPRTQRGRAPAEPSQVPKFEIPNLIESAGEGFVKMKPITRTPMSKSIAAAEAVRAAREGPFRRSSGITSTADLAQSIDPSIVKAATQSQSQSIAQLAAQAAVKSSNVKTLNLPLPSPSALAQTTKTLQGALTTTAKTSIFAGARTTARPKSIFGQLSSQSPQFFTAPGAVSVQSITRQSNRNIQEPDVISSTVLRQQPSNVQADFLAQQVRPSQTNRPVQDNRFIQDIRPIQDNRRLTENRPLQDNRPIQDNRFIQDIRPIQTNRPIQDIRQVLDIRPVQDIRPPNPNRPGIQPPTTPPPPPPPTGGGFLLPPPGGSGSRNARTNFVFGRSFKYAPDLATLGLGKTAKATQSGGLSALTGTGLRPIMGQPKGGRSINDLIPRSRKRR